MSLKKYEPSSAPLSPGTLPEYIMRELRRIGALFQEYSEKFDEVDASLSAVATSLSAVDVINVQVRNTTGATIPKGSAVYISGSTGANLPNVALAQANTLASSRAIGLAQTDISNNANGWVVSTGIVGGLNTSAFSAGDPLYVSVSTPGGLQNTRPSVAGQFIHILGYCTIANVSVGEIKVLPGALSLEVSSGGAGGDTDVGAGLTLSGSVVELNLAELSLWASGSISDVRVLGYDASKGHVLVSVTSFPTGSGSGVTLPGSASANPGDILAWDGSDWAVLRAGSQTDAYKGSPSVWTDEFDWGTALDTAGSRFTGAIPWTQTVFSGSVSHTVARSCLILYTPSGSARTSLSISASTWTVECKFYMTPTSGFAFANYQHCGIHAYAGSTTKWTSGHFIHTTNLAWEKARWTASTFGSATNVTSINANDDAARRWIYLRLVYDGTNLTWYQSFNGLPETWIQLFTETQAAWLAAAPTEVGITFQTSGGGALTACVDYFRRVA